MTEQKLISEEMRLAEKKAIDALSRYKFVMFGYWAAIWVHLNRIGPKRRSNPFKEIVNKAKEMNLWEKWNQ